ncbi:MAG: DNA repair protein RadC [Ignavibacteriales bacterium]|nr:DNA repair protein RadC [Ignavibacteriales bacterium]
MLKIKQKVSEPSAYHQKISDWPLGDRPREKLIKYGADTLTEAELIAILLRTGAGKITAVDIGKLLIKEFISLDRLAKKSYSELQSFKGVGPAKAISLCAAFELGRRAAVEQKKERKTISTPEDVVSIYLPGLRDAQQEIFKVLFLDSANHLLGDRLITTGILNSSLVHPREVYKYAIIESAASIIILHNHPSGNPEPSSDDIQITRQISEAGKILGIPLHDHIILAREKYASFAEKGLL